MHFDNDERNRSVAMLVVSFVLKVRCQTAKIVQRSQFASRLKSVSKRMSC